MATTIPAPPPGFAPITPAAPPGFAPALEYSNIDAGTGAPASLRAMLAAYSKPEDKLRALKKYFPDAQPFGEDNFVYTNPKTKQPTLFNPKGPDVGDIAEFGRVVPEILGGIAGGSMGTMMAPGPGTIAGGIGGSQFAGEMYDLAMRSTAGVPSTRTYGEAAQDVGINTALDLATLGAGEFVGPGLRRVFGSKQGVEAGQAAERLGMGPLPTGTVSGRGIATLESGLQQTLGAGRSIDALYERSIKELDEAMTRLAGEGAGMSKAQGGQMIIDAATKFKQKFNDRSNAMYAQLDKLIPQGQVFQANSTARAIEELSGAGVDSQKLAALLTPSGLVQKMKALYNDKGFTILGPDGKPLMQNMGSVSYADMKKLRTHVGQRLANPSSIDGTELAALKRVYAALTDDMNNAGISLGGDAARAATKASRYFKRGMDAIETRVDPLIMQGKTVMDPQKIFGRVESGSRQQQQTLQRQLGAFVPPQTQQQLGGIQLQSLGANTRGAFSPEVLASSLGKLRAGTGQLPPTMGQIPGVQDVEMVANALNRARATTNRSNTAGALGTMSTLGGISAGLVTGDVSTGVMTALTSLGLPLVVNSLVQLPVVRNILSDTVSDSSKKVMQLVAIGINEPVAKSLVEDKYKGGGLMGTLPTAGK